MYDVCYKGAPCQTEQLAVSVSNRGRLLQVSCSMTGLCIGSKPLALTASAPPVISLVNTTYLSSLVLVKQGHSYAACTTSQQPTSGTVHSLSLLLSWQPSSACCGFAVITLTLSAIGRKRHIVWPCQNAETRKDVA